MLHRITFTLAAYLPPLFLQRRSAPFKNAFINTKKAFFFMSEKPYFKLF
jgi:hypothetical protein